MTTKNDPLVGTTYDGRYRIERRIGAGGMANVYLAEDDTLGRRVAIKVLHQRFAEDSQFIERFQREASAAARLNHPNIVQVYDRGSAGDSYYIAMEYVDGMTLKQLVQRRGGLTEQEVLAYGRQALHALRFAHRNGIVHRDVKPHNMMVDTDGRLKIADFGIARAGADSGLTEAGSIVGTAQYLSPEQAQGQHVAATSDLYSLGVVMFEMATGRVPFDGDSPVNVALKHVKDPVPRPTSFNPNISPAIESIILKAMEKDQADRYGSADEMLADLDRAREGSDTQAMTQVMGGAALGAAAGTRVQPITPAVAAPRTYERELPPEPAWDNDDDETTRSPWRWLVPLLIGFLLLGLMLWFFLFSGGDKVLVPDVVGETVAAATETLEDDGFRVGTPKLEHSEDVDKGRVISQDPDAGDKADKGSKVNLVVSDGPPPIEVPDVVNLSRAKALETIEKAGFVYAQAPKREASDEIAKGFVTTQSPKAGDELEEGGTVTVTLSAGPETTEVPDVTGMPVREARDLLTGDEYGFEVTVREVDAPQEAGEVVGQSPSRGDQLAKGDRITLQVASGYNAVPSVTGTGRDEALNALGEAGFKTSTSTEQTTDSAKVGVVLRTSPGGSQRAQVGSTVNVVIGEGGAAPPPAEDTPEDETPPIG
ncbi:MAG: Stk1 family PASTA domain-containing Ser/Thr kinase [Gaiellales bacterium]